MTVDTLHKLVAMLGAETKTHVMARIEAAVAPLEARIAALERRPHGLKFVGAWVAGTAYQTGDVAQRKGVWCAMEDTTDQPGTSAAWRLMARDGRDGRDGKDLTR